MLSTIVLAGLVAFVFQTLFKPLLKETALKTARYQSSYLQFAVGLLSYLAAVCNQAATGHFSAAIAWNLLLNAGQVFAAAVATYHVLTANVPQVMTALESVVGDSIAKALPAQPAPKIAALDITAPLLAMHAAPEAGTTMSATVAAGPVVEAPPAP